KIDRMADTDNTQSSSTDDNQSIQQEQKEEETTTTPVVVFKKQTKNRGNIRKRDTETTITDENNTDGGGDGDTSNKKQRHTAAKVNQYTTITDKKNDFSFASTGSAKPSYSEADSSSTLIEREDNNEKKDEDGPTNDDGLYRGMKSYNTFFEKKSDLTYKGAGVKAGPIKVTTSNYRSSVRFDFQPDVCKDYKETGQCSFGDTCKFLHDRGDYKAGWQVEKEYEEQQLRKRKEKQNQKEEEFKKATGDDEELPFACFICRQEYDNPVMTKCKHFFCEKCALDHNRKSKKCFVCKEATLGTFSQPKKIIDKLMERSRQHFI
ncbi:hypothetical protein SAMD00019534_026120, partial [Acytostelium subglobosum LB1]|uniref:hypothetical protein n=1 Tax=Acytostelium subglobosum LB1 TaxID=1410327 RepID=UPI000644B40D